MQSTKMLGRKVWIGEPLSGVVKADQRGAKNLRTSKSRKLRV